MDPILALLRDAERRQERCLQEMDRGMAQRPLTRAQIREIYRRYDVEQAKINALFDRADALRRMSESLVIY